MTFLLKSVWRNVLRSTSLSKSNLRSTSLSSSISEVTRARSPDAIMSSIKNAPSTADVLAAVQIHLPVMTHRHLLQALRVLFALHKTSKHQDHDQESDKLIKDPAFGVLLQNFKKHARSLDVNEAIEATKVLSYLRVPVDSIILQTLLQLIRSNINMINTRQIMFLDFILNQFDSRNHLVDALKLALPLAFQIHLPLELDHEDLPLLRDMLAYCCVHDLPDRCVNNVVTGLLLHDQAIDAPTAKSIIWSLCHINCTEEVFPTRVQLLHICCDILTQNINQLSYDDVLRTAAKIKGRVVEKHPEFYHQQLMDAIAQYIVQNEVEFEKGLLIARVLSRIAHTHLGLVDYLCQLAVCNPNTLSDARTNILFGFINCLSNNNFTPEQEHWKEIRRQISANPVLKGTTTRLPWTKVCLELASLGFYEDSTLNRVFSKEFLDDYLSVTCSNLDYIQLLTLYQAVKTFHSDEYELPSYVMEKAKALYPIHAMTSQVEAHLVRGLGGPEYAVRNVVLPTGVVADILVCLKNGYPVKLPALSSNTKVPIENLNIPEASLVLCIMNYNQGCFSMNSNRLRGTFRLILDILEKQGYATVALNIHEWINAPAHEKTPYLMREIAYRCGESGMKLSAT